MQDFLNVYLNNDLIGILSKDGNGGVNYQYIKNAKQRYLGITAQEIDEAYASLDL